MRSPHTTQFSVEGHPFRYRDHVGLGSKQLFCNDKRNRISGKQNSFSIVLPCRQHTNPTSWQAMIVENIGTSSTLNAPRNLKKNTYYMYNNMPADLATLKPGPPKHKPYEKIQPLHIRTLKTLFTDASETVTSPFAHLILCFPWRGRRWHLRRHRHLLPKRFV